MNFCKDCKHRATGVRYYRDGDGKEWLCLKNVADYELNKVDGSIHPVVTQRVWLKGIPFNSCAESHPGDDCPSWEPKPRKWWQVWRAR